MLPRLALFVNSIFVSKKMDSKGAKADAAAAEAEKKRIAEVLNTMKTCMAPDDVKAVQFKVLNSINANTVLYKLEEQQEAFENDDGEEVGAVDDDGNPVFVNTLNPYWLRAHPPDAQEQRESGNPSLVVPLDDAMHLKLYGIELGGDEVSNAEDSEEEDEDDEKEEGEDDDEDSGVEHAAGAKFRRAVAPSGAASFKKESATPPDATDTPLRLKCMSIMGDDAPDLKAFLRMHSNGTSHIYGQINGDFSLLAHAYAHMKPGLIPQLQKMHIYGIRVRDHKWVSQVVRPSADALAAVFALLSSSS